MNRSTREIISKFKFKTDKNAVAYNKKYNFYALSSTYSDVEFYSPDGELKSKTLLINKNTSITYTKEGYFSGTGDFNKHVHFVDDDLNTYDYRQFASKFYRPELIASIVSGQMNEAETLKDVIASKPAPLVRLNQSICSRTVNEDTLELSFNLSDSGGGIGDVLIYINGSMVKNSKRALKQSAQSFSETLALSNGDNLIEIIAYNRDNSLAGTPVKCNVTASFEADKPTLHIVALGINQYENTDLNLKFAEADANYFVDTLQNVSSDYFSKINVTKLTSFEETGKQHIMDKVAEVSKGVKADDYFIFFTASHGDIVTLNNDSKYFLITSNTVFLDPENLESDALSQEDIVAMIGNVPARNKIIIMDTCHSGQAGKQIQKVLFRGMSNKTAVELIRMASGSSVFTASQKAEQALEGYKNHGLFTYTLVEGLLGKADKDKDGHVMLSELKSYVERTVYKRSKEVYKTKQIPYINIGSLDIPIATSK